MNNQKYRSMWKIMRNNNFEINANINSEHLCTICKKILIDACNAPCGCRYCKECITDYLQGQRKNCPGNTECCKDELISFDSDIQLDRAINTRISRLIVTCPNIGCQTKVDIKSMENHLEMCEHRSVSCPFINIGCGDNISTTDKINEHLLSEVHSHTKLLMEWVNISRNETELLKNDINQLRSDNYNTKEKMETENIIRELQKGLKNNSEQIEKLRNENRLLKGELRDLQDTHRVEQASNLGLREKVENQLQEIDQLKQECQMKETRLNEKFEIQNKKSEINRKLDEISLSNAALKESSNEMIQSILDIQEFIDMFRDFVWKIDRWTEKQNQAKTGNNTNIYSKPFYSSKNGYKMCLRVDPDGFGNGKGTHLSIFYCIMRGPYDEILQWPFKHDVEISLMNQKTGLVHSTYSVKYSVCPESTSLIKPITDQNIALGFHQYIKLDEISTIPGLCENDQIAIKCIIKPL